MEIFNIVLKIRRIAFLLFLFTSVALVGSLLINNYLVSFKFKFHEKNSKFLKDVPGNFYENSCNKENGYCYNEDFRSIYHERNLTLGKCFIYETQERYFIEGKSYDIGEVIDKNKIREKKGFFLTESFKDKKNITLRKTVLNKKNGTCIKNSYSYIFYKIFPSYFNYIANSKENGLIKLSTSEVINPFFYGEVSISNLVKRYPINIFFKSILYLSVILMFYYWYCYNKFFKEKFNKNKNTFFFLGICSAFFLFFHVLFLGQEIDNEIFKKVRRLIIVLFILFELLAQIFLAKDLFGNRSVLLNLCFKKIILIKIGFVSIISLSTILILALLIFKNFPSNIDYILEWNYFLILLIFYFLSSIMWKKNS